MHVQPGSVLGPYIGLEARASVGRRVHDFHARPRAASRAGHFLMTWWVCRAGMESGYPVPPELVPGRVVIALD